MVDATQQEIDGWIDLPKGFLDGPECPSCGCGKTEIVGGFNAVSYIECLACGYYGDWWVEDGATNHQEVLTGDQRQPDNGLF
jgi:Zn ribbon nucleic-acid-binding protein